MPDKIIHQIQVDGYCARFGGKWGRLQLGTFGSYGIEQLQISLGDSRADLVVYANFVTADGATPVLVPESGLVDVPPEATAKPGMGNIVLDGTADGVRIYSVDVPYIMLNHSDLSSEAPAPTPDRWQQFIAQVKADADRAEQAAGAASDSAAAAAKSAEAAAESAKQAEQAGADIGAAKDDALDAIQQAQDTGVQAVEGATTTGVQAVRQAHQDAIDDIATDRQQALADIEDVGDKQQSAITSSGAAALEAIGQTEQAAIGQVEQAGTAQVTAVETAGQAQLDKINAANALVPTPTQADAGKAIIVKPDGSGYELGEVQTDAYTKAESDARYAPIEAAIRPTVSGNPATLEHSVAWAMQGLSVYGKSTQDGEPSPDNPVPIVSAGDAGSIAVTVSNGADQSQQLVISTPNGLPGIPVDSGGNYTDASGQQWVCDEVDFARGAYVQRVEQITFDGSSDELWTMVTNGATQRNYFQIAVEKTAFRYNDGDVLLCSAFPHMRYGYAEPSGDNTASFTSNNNTFACSTSLFDSVDDWRQYLSGNAMTLIYAIATPIETPLSAEELAAYAALRSYNGTTVVAADAPVAGLSARYVADGAAYIDSKIQSAVTQAVAAAVSLTGGAQ